MSQLTTRRETALRLVPRVKVWLERDGRYAFGFGIAEILQAVDQAGSIKQAAGDLGKSYRYVWGRIKDAERVLGRQLVTSRSFSKNGKRSECSRGHVRRCLEPWRHKPEAPAKEPSWLHKGEPAAFARASGLWSRKESFGTVSSCPAKNPDCSRPTGLVIFVDWAVLSDKRLDKQHAVGHAFVGLLPEHLRAPAAEHVARKPFPQPEGGRRR